MTPSQPSDVTVLFDRAGAALDVDTRRLRGRVDRSIERRTPGATGVGPRRSRRAWLGAGAAAAAVAVMVAGVATWRASTSEVTPSVASPAGGGGSADIPGLPLPDLPVRTSEVAPHLLPGVPRLPVSQRTIDNLEPAYGPGASRARVSGPVTPVLAFDNGYRERIWAVAPAYWATGERSVCRLKVVAGVDIDDPGMWDESILCMSAPRGKALTATGKAALLYEDFASIPAERGKLLAFAVVSERARACSAARDGSSTPLDHRVRVAGTDFAFVYGLVDPDDRGLLRVSCTT